MSDRKFGKLKQTTELRSAVPNDGGRCTSFGGPSNQPERCVLPTNHQGSHVSHDCGGRGRLEWDIEPPPPITERSDR